MLPEEIRESLIHEIAQVEFPREKAIDVMYVLQRHYGYMSDEAMEVAAGLLGMTTLELDELATFYDYIYREPVGKYVIQICDSTLCWMEDGQSVADYLCSRLGIQMGGTTSDGLFTLLPVCCIGYCDRAPAMLVDRSAYGRLTPDKIDRILDSWRDKSKSSEKA
jgi:NADH-quinone oxidoreductase subunit E